MEIKAIPTKFDGYQFRSRTEARWAVFFKEMCINYIYEHEGYIIPDVGPYLPDFYLPDFDCYIEIKGSLESEEQFKSAFDRVWGLCKFVQKDVILAVGIPRNDLKITWFHPFFGIPRTNNDMTVKSWLLNFGLNESRLAGHGASSFRFGKIA